MQPRLTALFASWGHRIRDPRARGFALAFELASPAELNEYLAQRFWRGAIVFGAGDRTVRYRLNASFQEREIDQLFVTIRQSLAWLEAHPGKKAPEWEDLEEAAPRKLDDIVVREARAEEAATLMPQILAIETRTYEPARRDPEARLRAGFEDADGVAIVAERLIDGKRVVVGYAIGVALERVPEIVGPARDPARGRHDSLYSVALTVDPSVQNSGLGRRLKHAQLRAARDKQRSDGSARYRFCVGRNRVGMAEAMGRLNDELGAHTVFTVENAYDREGTARYYRQPLRGIAALDPPARLPTELQLGSGLVAPFAVPPASLVLAENAGLVAGAAIDKITICNYVTPAIARATEWAAALVPDLPHLFLTSGRDETIDKSVRMLRWHRKSGRVVLSFAGAYVGHTTACARSVSDPTTHRGGPPHFDFPRVPHPAEVGEVAAIEGLRAAIVTAGADAVLGIYAEMVQERTGRVLTDTFVAALDALRSETGVPIVLVETASAYYRSGRGAFASTPLRKTFVPDALVWWTGGQQGFVHVTSKLYVAAPLTFVSTWDGDELSLIQAHHQLRAARHVDVGTLAAELDRALEPLAARGAPASGLGLYRVIAAGDRAGELVSTLEKCGIHVSAFANGAIGIAPPLDIGSTAIASLREALALWR